MNRFLVWRVDERPARAWFLPLTDGEEESILDGWKGDPDDLLPLFDRAEPLQDESSRPEGRTVSVEAGKPGWVIVSQLDDPQWSVRWSAWTARANSGGRSCPPSASRATPRAAGRPIQVPFIGRWTLRLTYELCDVVQGAGISMVAWICWAFFFALAALRRRPG